MWSNNCIRLGITIGYIGIITSIMVVECSRRKERVQWSQHWGYAIFVAFMVLVGHSDVAGKGELDRGGGKKREIVNELHGLQLVLRLYLMGLPLLGPPLHSYNPSAAPCVLGMSAHISD
jgi:hypothetical protein